MKISKNIDTVFFDLDGTLLPMDAEEFMAAYFKELAAKAAPMGYDAKTVVDSVWIATRAMMANDGTVSNKERFWTAFGEIPGINTAELEIPFDGFYREEFDRVKTAARENPHLRPLIDHLKNRGYTLVVATNPLFPLDGNLTRMNWVGLTAQDFHYISSYENSSYCKPNPKYYQDILEKLGKTAGSAIMIGNDAAEDLAAEKCGMDTFLVKDHLINSRNMDISSFKQGMFADLHEFFGVPKAGEINDG